MKKIGMLLNLLLFACVLIIFPVTSSVAAEEMYEEVSTEDMLYARGIISGVSLEKMRITIRPAKGKLIWVNIDPDTILEGVSLIDELQKEQQVKVWYSIDVDGNKAVKIKKMMELGC